MARITVEDCLDNVDNRFELVLLAAKRARQLNNGAEAKLPWGTDKATVLALREISKGLVTNETIVEAPRDEPESAPEADMVDHVTGNVGDTAA